MSRVTIAGTAGAKARLAAGLFSEPEFAAGELGRLNRLLGRAIARCDALVGSSLARHGRRAKRHDRDVRRAEHRFAAAVDRNPAATLVMDTLNADWAPEGGAL